MLNTCRKNNEKLLGATFLPHPVRCRLAVNGCCKSSYTV